MKKTIFIGILMLSAILKGQNTIPNGDFEDWSPIAGDVPDAPWYNFFYYTDLAQNNVPGVKRVSGHNGFACHVETIQIHSGPLLNTISNSSDLNLSSGTLKGGVPLSLKPTHLKGYYRCNLPGTDTAVIVLGFKKNGIKIVTLQAKFKNTLSPGFIPFDFPISIPTVPDSVVVQIHSSNINTPNKAIAGSYIELDELSFTDGVNSVPLFGGDFEKWKNLGLENPNSWFQYISAKKTTDSYSGKYAVVMETTPDDKGELFPGILGNYTYKNLMDSMPCGGFKANFTKKDTLTGYYKFISPLDPGNYAAVSGFAWNPKYRRQIGELLYPTAVYSYFEVPIDTLLISNGGLDSLQLSFSSEGTDDDIIPSSHYGCKLYVDKLSFKSSTTGIKIHETENIPCYLFPQPAHNEVKLSFNYYSNCNSLIQLRDCKGSVVVEKNYSITYGNNTIMLDVSAFSPGLYSATILTDKMLVRKNLLVE